MQSSSVVVTEITCKSPCARNEAAAHSRSAAMHIWAQGAKTGLHQLGRSLVESEAESQRSVVASWAGRRRGAGCL